MQYCLKAKKGTHLRRLAGFLFVIFALNLFGEMKIGHCHETCTQEQPSHKDSVKSADHDASSEAGDAHICHFGHCSHIVLLAGLSMPAHVQIPIVWIAKNENPLWRHLAPLLKPPIV